MKSVIFDLDGTLLNTLDDLSDSVNYSLATYGYPQRTSEEVKKNIGGGAGNLIKKLMPASASETEVQECLTTFLKYYKANSDNKTDLYRGIKELVTKLYHEHYALGVVSAKDDKTVKKLISEYLGGMITVAIGEMAGVPKKPAPDSLNKAMKLLGSAPENTLYIGDTEVDVATAKNADVRCVSVTWGFRPREELKRLNAEYLADNPDDVYRIICNVLK